MNNEIVTAAINNVVILSEELKQELKETVTQLFNAGIQVGIVEDFCRFKFINKVPGLTSERIKNMVKSMYDSLIVRTGPFFRIREMYGEESAVISSVDLMDFLQGKGFAKYYIKNDHCFVNIKDNKVKEVTPPQIKDFVIGFLQDYKIAAKYVKMLREEFIDSTKLLSSKFLEYLKPKDMLFKRDKENEAYFFYRNGFVTVSRGNGIKFQEYKDFNDFIWDSQIIQRDFKLLESTDKKSDFEQFVFNVSRGDEGRFNTICSAIGYMLHNYKDSTKAKAIVFCDEKISDSPNGRTGKSLIGKAISKLRNSVREDGKTFNFSERFAFQKVELATQVLEFNDVIKSFNFEKLFSIITDSMTIEKKGQHAYSIPFDQSPKILISTNFTIRGSSDSYKARLFEIEFSDFYNADHQPIDDFGKMFFDNWTEEEWHEFDNFMLFCTKLYLDRGLIEYTPINIKKRKAIDLTRLEFVQFVEDKLKVGQEYSKSLELYNFKQEYPEFESITSNTFTGYLKKYCKELDLEYKSRNSNGVQYFTISEKVKSRSVESEK